MKRLILFFGFILLIVNLQAQPGYEFKQAISVNESKPQQAGFSWENFIAFCNSGLAASIIGIGGTILGFKLSSSKDDKRRKEDEKKRNHEKLIELKSSIHSTIYRLSNFGKGLLEAQFHYTYYFTRMTLGRERTSPNDFAESEKARLIFVADKEKWEALVAELMTPTQVITHLVKTTEEESKKMTELIQEFISLDFNLFQDLRFEWQKENNNTEDFPYIWDLDSRKKDIIQKDFFEGIIYPMQKFVNELEIPEEEK